MGNKIKIIDTEDGSHTLYNEELDETYHSIHGAKTESQHVFINNGLKLIEKSSISVLEIGFGTGLNALLTYAYQVAHSFIDNIHYHTLEKFPLNNEIIDVLNYSLKEDVREYDFFRRIHECSWNVPQEIVKGFWLNKYEEDLCEFVPSFSYDIVYFDAFAPDVQPSLWTKEIFALLFKHLNEGGVLSTYSAKGQLRRDLIDVGFRVERRPGPPGKREMIVAFKDSSL